MGVDISVIVPFYNAGRYIENCASALLSQDYSQDHYEIIMVDNNSTDQSAAVVRRHPRIKLLAEHKQGAYAARNRGAAHAKARIIAFTDSDCAPRADWLANIRKAMLDPDVGVVFGSRRFAFDSVGLSMLAAYENEKAAYVFSGPIKEIYYGYTNNMAVRRSLFNKLGPFVEMRRGGDVIFTRRAIDEHTCTIVCYAPDVCVRHLEITSIWKWYQKMFVYGKSLHEYGKIETSRPLSNAERLQVVKRTWQRNEYSLAKSALLFALLCKSGICYELGRRQAVWSLKRGKMDVVEE